MTAQRLPAAAALYVDGITYTYAQLRAVANGLARIFTELGLSNKQARIGVCCGKSVAGYASLLAIMEEGCVYVPINHEFPTARINEILLAAELSLLVAVPDLLGNFPADAGLFRVVFENGKWQMPDLASCPTTPTPMPTGDGAYLLFTSGTSGTPKGILVGHSNLIACVEHLAKVVPLTEEDRLAQFAPLNFDISLGDVFLCWTFGACVCAPARSDVYYPPPFLERAKITVWSSVPTLANNVRYLGLLGRAEFKSIRLSLFCGEPLPVSLAKDWLASIPGSQLVNLYGPTEATIYATFHFFDGNTAPDQSFVPIGSPFPSVLTDIAKDPDSNPDMVRGELLLGGSQVPSRYWNADQTTNQAFSTDSDGNNWYRTGDQVEVDAIGVMHYVGRLNRQIKINGHRIELGEIETIVTDVAKCAACAVVPLLQEDGRCEEIVAFCLGLNVPPSEVLRMSRLRLPHYAVPARVILLNELPVNASGKTDYGHLQKMALMENRE